MKPRETRGFHSCLLATFRIANAALYQLSYGPEVLVWIDRQPAVWMCENYVVPTRLSREGTNAGRLCGSNVHITLMLNGRGWSLCTFDSAAVVRHGLFVPIIPVIRFVPLLLDGIMGEARSTSGASHLWQMAALGCVAIAYFAPVSEVVAQHPHALHGEGAIVQHQDELHSHEFHEVPLHQPVCKDPGHPEKPHRKMPGDRDRGDCPPLRYTMDDCERAGAPCAVAPWAKSSVTEKYSAWFTGGGAAFWRSRPRKCDEGTWGLDYNGLFGHANIWLNYTCGRNQGGEGAYETVGGPEPLSFLHHD